MDHSVVGLDGSESSHRHLARWNIVLQPISETFTQPQLVTEVKRIFDSLVKIEIRCADLVAHYSRLLRQEPTSPAVSSPNEWQVLIRMHRALLNEHLDFFQASQHPNSSVELRGLALKFSMPARLWTHGIINFLELLRRHLPDSMEWMLVFIYLAYQMMTLLMETVPALKETWTECLGDLGRYRMAISEDPQDRANWTDTARLWYLKGVDKAFHTGRFYHHLALLARSNAVEQLSLYGRSLQAVQPFYLGMSSIRSLLQPMSWKKSEADKPLSNEASLVKVHANIFLAGSLEMFSERCGVYQGTLDQAIADSGPRWRGQGCWTAICIVTAVLGWGMESPLREIYENASAAPAMEVASPAANEGPTPTAASIFPHESQEKSFTLALCTLQVVLARPSDKNILPFIHVILIFAYSASRMEAGPEYIAPWMQWDALCSLLNSILQSRNTIDKRPLDACDPHKDAQRKPIYEEYQVRGQVWAPDYLDKAFFGPASDGEDERRLGDSEAHLNRINRIVHLGMGIAAAKTTGHRWLHYNTSSARFYVK